MTERLVPVTALAPPAGSVPERVLLAWHPFVAEKAIAYARAKDAGVTIAGARLHVGEWAGSPVGVLAPGPGPAATALAVEGLVTGGARILFGVGRAWVVGAFDAPERLVVADGAVALDAVTPRFGVGARVPASRNAREALSAACEHENMLSREATVATVDAPALVDAASVRRAGEAGATVLDGQTAPLLAAVRAHGARAGVILAVEAALARFADGEWSMDAGGSPVEHGWFPEDAAEVERVTRAAVRAAYSALLGDLVAMAEPEGAGAP